MDNFFVVQQTLDGVRTCPFSCDPTDRSLAGLVGMPTLLSLYLLEPRRLCRCMRVKISHSFCLSIKFLLCTCFPFFFLLFPPRHPNSWVVREFLFVLISAVVCFFSVFQSFLSIQGPFPGLWLFPPNCLTLDFVHPFSTCGLAVGDSTPSPVYPM